MPAKPYCSLNLWVFVFLSVWYFNDCKPDASALGHHHHHAKSEPDVFLFGMERSATTSLHNILRSHPDICGKVTPKLNFFDQDREFAKVFDSKYF